MKYQPGPVPDDKWLRSWLVSELRRISNAIGAAEYVQLTPIDVEPQRPSKGMNVWALATPVSGWDPGAGEGQYVYNGATWDKVN